ncbi:hypothetical protein FB45DRAFT_1070376 [Roridomyces roridus]|uniref:NRPS-like enzyme n=1 Tax=Roridomyces roridus TaxID=1738132 RepID=A0AAD7AZ12_9AGAR|nr:hypothetical protein FB45DRAFT_1070376 [Roridomyces roridus]
MPLDTLPGLLSRNAEQRPQDPFYVYADVENDSIVTITQLEFSCATHRAAHLLRPNRSGQDGKVVAIIAESDTILYHAVFLGLMTANFVPFPISPRNSPPAILQLLRTSACHHIISTCITLAPLLARLEEHIKDVDPEFELAIQEMPSLHEIYPNLGVETADHAFQPYPEGSFNPNLEDVVMYVHSSGSTGFPKAVGWNYRIVHYMIAYSTSDTDSKLHAPVAAMALPPFHTFGIGFQVATPLCGIYAAVYPPTATRRDALPMIPSPDNVLEHARRTKSRTLCTVPAFMVEWFNSPEAFEYLKTLHSIIWGGGPLPQRVGDGYIAAGVRLLSAYGTTEAGRIAALIPYEDDLKEWAWFRISDHVKVRWEPQGDGTFESQILATEKHVPLVLNLPDVKGYATSDLCVNHPTKKHLWRIIGRLDDTIVHTSGEKTVPAPMENIIIGSPLVKGVVVFGHERPQTGVLLEMAPEVHVDVTDRSQLAQLRNKIWPVIEEANAMAPAYSRIFKELILFASSDKPLPRAGKGTVLRKAAIHLYAAEIDALYNTVEEHAVDCIEAPTIWKVDFIQPWLMEVAASVCNFTAILATMDLRQQGFDSLTATVFRLHVSRGLRTGQLENVAAVLPQDLVYSRPTIGELSDFLEALVTGTLTESEIQASPSKLDYKPPITTDIVVEIRRDSSDTIPLIVFPGVRGTLNSTRALAANYSGTVWGVQIIESTPIEPFSTLAEFLTAAIRAKRPNGPYRLSGYSGSSVVVVAVAKMLEEAGEEVVQLSFIDHFPLLWTTEDMYGALRDPTRRRARAEGTSEGVIQLLRLDPLFGPESKGVKELEAIVAKAALGEESGINPDEIAWISIRRRSMASLLDFLAGFLPQEGPEAPREYADAVNRWLSSVNAPLSAITAEFGVAAAMSEEVRREWSDLGAAKCLKPVKHLWLTGVGHSGIMGDRRMAEFLKQQCP